MLVLTAVVYVAALVSNLAPSYLGESRRSSERRIEPLRERDLGGFTHLLEKWQRSQGGQMVIWVGASRENDIEVVSQLQLSLAVWLPLVKLGEHWLDSGSLNEERRRVYPRAMVVDKRPRFEPPAGFQDGYEVG